MDSQSLSGLMFLSGLAAMPAGCAKGTEERAKAPPFTSTAGEGDDEEGRDSFDPFATSGDLPDSGASPGDSNDPPGPDSSEGETGVVSEGSGKDEGTGLPDSTEGDPSDSGSTGGAAVTTDNGEGEESSTGSIGGYDPCPYVADLYAECIEAVTYEAELDYCQGVLQAAYDDSAGCGMAFGDYLACLSFLDCATLLAKGVPTECAAEHAVVQGACSG